jgi:AcrR family transcriptional regulator
MAAGAARLLAERGLPGASFSEVLELTSAPRGSIYHHFPGGKDELVDAALVLSGDRVLTGLDGAGDSAEAVASAFLGYWRKLLVHSGFGVGCAVLAVTVETRSPDLLDRVAEVFRSWVDRLTVLLAERGLAESEARRLAVLLVASAEGAVVLSRADRSVEPFDAVSEQLLAEARRLGSETST